MGLRRKPLNRWLRARRRRGQSILELALALPMLMILLIGITEMGFLFYAYVQVSNATREGARAGTRYMYRAEYTVLKNDKNRGWGASVSADDRYANNVADAVSQSLGYLPVDGSTFNPGACGCSASDDDAVPSTSTHGTADLKIVYPETLDATNNPYRAGQQIRVEVTYHYQLPVTSAFLPAPGVVDLKATTTMMIAGR